MEILGDVGGLLGRHWGQSGPLEYEVDVREVRPADEYEQVFGDSRANVYGLPFSLGCIAQVFNEYRLSIVEVV